VVVDSRALRGVRHGFVAVLAVGSARCSPEPGCSSRSRSGPNTRPPQCAPGRLCAGGAARFDDPPRHPPPLGLVRWSTSGAINTADPLQRLRIGAQITWPPPHLVEPTADEPLSRVDRLLRSKDQLAPGEPADQPLTILGEPDHRRRGPLGRLGPLSSSRRVRRAQLRGSAARMCLRTRTARFGRR
jgi:NAD-specific glutamate dehydrogenase